MNEEGFQYFLHSSRHFLIKLSSDWVKTSSPVGSVISCSGQVKYDIAYPPNAGEAVSIRGLASGDEKHINLVVSQWGNRLDYIARFDLKEKIYIGTFEGAR
ncbi:hypothetical protein SNR37_003587 [Agarivorans aestuarii]|uniref:Uncharacterized protein n=1 Tax=Agarivorans aestuarii TaxID=1563703 RepID=A0ABU7G415_9ALTE|nr:hypothetical protein [Agarivorans aestuarii]MEE1674152.1 hypothetical protein [Agarivorans aestuarii]